MSFLNKSNRNYENKAVSSDTNNNDNIEIYWTLSKYDVKLADRVWNEVKELQMKLRRMEYELQIKDIKLEMMDRELKIKDMKLEMMDMEHKIKDIELEMKNMEDIDEDEAHHFKDNSTLKDMFDFYLCLCFGELHGLGVYKPSVKFINVSKSLLIMKMYDQQALPYDGYCAKLLSAVDECKVNLSNVYKTMCKDIHGGPLHGPEVPTLTERMLTPGEKSLVLFIADSLHITITEE